MATGIKLIGVGKEDTLRGGVGDDTLLGGGYADLLIGEGGDDVLDGGSGPDRMEGGAGNDTYYVQNAADLAIEVAGGGIDKVIVGRSWVLGSNLEQLALTGTAFAATGNGLDNTLTGNSSTNRMNGMAGADTMSGGDGDDVYYVDNKGDRVVESAGADGGSDRVYSTVSFTLGDHVETLFLEGSGNLKGTGNALANLLRGNAGNNTLNGKAGADTLRGGDGNDTYYVHQAGDVVAESTDSGIDTVISAISYTTGNHVENLTLGGSGNTRATGNSLANTLQGNAGNNLLDGLGGADTMRGGDGNDTYRVQNAADTVVEAAGAGVDRVEANRSWTLSDNVEHLVLTQTGTRGTGNALANTLTGNSANNTLDGKAGADTMSGGKGDDIYRVDNAGDAVRESAGSGTDRVLSSRSWTLGDHIEQLYLEGTGNTSATGNALANLLRGNSGDNVLDGKAGADVMRGYEGNDSYRVDNVGDDISESSLATGGIDTVVSTLSWKLKGYFEHLTLAGSTDFIYGIGNASANVLTGNSGINGLAGGAGDDTLDGGAGRDGLLGGSGADVFRFSSVGHSTAGAFDGIGDFVRGTDRIDLSALDGKAGVSGRQDFSFIGSAAFGADATGQLRYERVTQQAIDAAEQLLNQAGVVIDLKASSAVMLYGSTDADAQAEFALVVVGATALAAADLML